MTHDSYRHAEHVAEQPGVPLIFVFHGTGGDEFQFFDLAREMLPNASVVAPRGDVSEGGALRFFRRTAEGVYDMEDLAARSDRIAAFVDAKVEALRPSTVLGLGYSNGANILATTMFSRPDRFDACVLMHPLIPFEPEIQGDLGGRHVLVTAGRKDPICPPHLTHRLISYLEAANAALEVVWHDGAHEIRPVEIDAAQRLFDRIGGARVMSEIELDESEAKGRYLLAGPAGAVAEMTFTKVGATQLIIDHTEVPDAMRGQGAGERLVERAVADARQKGQTVIPLCPFAAAQFRRHPEWSDVLRRR